MMLQNDSLFYLFLESLAKEDVYISRSSNFNEEKLGFSFAGFNEMLQEMISDAEMVKIYILTLEIPEGETIVVYTKDMVKDFEKYFSVFMQALKDNGVVENLFKEHFSDWQSVKKYDKSIEGFRSYSIDLELAG